MPTRIEAARVLYQLINSGILSDDLEQDLQNIAQRIEAEEKKEIFLWGAKDDDWLSDSGCILLYYLNILTKTSHTQNGIRTLKIQYFS